MQLSARVQVSIEMMDIFFSSHAPFDLIMAKFFRNNRWIGSKDRREIAEFSYSIFRNFEKLRFFAANITSNFGRFYVLIFLKIEYKLSEGKIIEIFSGKPHAPPELIDFEKRFINSLDEKSEFPEHVLFNYPEWMAPLLKRSFASGDCASEIQAFNARAPVDLRVNTLKSSKDEVRKMLEDSGFQMADCEYSSNGLRLLKGRIGRNHDVIVNGLAEIQDEGSQLVAEVCAALPGNTVVDFCAGAGGKTLAIAAAMKNKGRIFALDKYEKRLENAAIRFRRANVNNVFCQQISGKWIKRHLECADIVLVDVPCSGIGTWRRNPDMRAKFTSEDLHELLILQEEILESAHRLVRKDGRLVYATCSILKEENEDQIAKFLNNHPEFEIQKIQLQNYCGNYLKLTPYKHKTDGFFAVSLIKNSNVDYAQSEFSCESKA
ncbi:MAG: RsmB/NOP family class I SAM-dependent RNA methyltransferase [Holosporaceae bacterium]|jgi:16S rRNA (cytosine967-C5)-methyltransferase|nr:RsmB/NOP family class I SAM-dependent RNA methyltransferase [Holosporaceae bacterium]